MKPKEPRLDGQYRTPVRVRGQTHNTVERAPTNRLMANLGLRILSIQEEVQQRIAADLHDSTCQHLIAASLNIMRLRRARTDRDNAEKICDDIDASINHALNEIRAFTYLLHPQNLLADGLKTTIEQYVEGFSARTSLKSGVAIAPEVDKLSYRAQRSVLRVIQEALTNVYRHAKASRVEIAIEATETHLRLRVNDDGCGIPTGQARLGTRAISLGVGIPGMRTRVHQLGGTLQIHSSTERGGTTLIAVIPHALGRKGTRTPERRRSQR
jgi:two-component system, NarL family, sensor kinase